METLIKKVVTEITFQEKVSTECRRLNLSHAYE